MEQSNYVIGADFSSKDGDITSIVVGEVIDGVFHIKDVRQMQCKPGDDINRQSEFKKTIAEYTKLYKASMLGKTKAFRKLMMKEGDKSFQQFLEGIRKKKIKPR